MKRGTVVAGATVTVVFHLTVATAAGESPSVGHSADRPGPIVFDSDRDGDPEIYLMESGVALSQPITQSGPGIFSRLPDWSPDCTEIVFQSNRLDSENEDLYVMRSDGSEVRRITRHPRSDSSPDWSPDGLMIAFASDRGREEAVWVIGSDGSGLRRITPGPNPAFQPSWSPDGTHIAYVSGSDENWDIYVARADGSSVRNLTNTPDRHEGGPSWSPSGRRIAFDGLRDEHWEIYVVDSDGSNERQLTRNKAVDARPSWSPDGTQIVFHSTRDFGSDGETQNWHEVDIYVMQSDGSDTRRLTNNQHFDAHPDWCSRRSSAGTIDTTSTQKSNVDWPH